MLWIENLGEIIVFDKLDSFQWSVPNLFADSSPTMNPCIASPWFSFEGDRWRLVLIPNTASQDEQTPGVTHVGLFLWRKCSDCCNVQFYLDLGLESKVGFLPNYTLLHELETKKDEDVGVFDFLPVTYFSDYKSAISPTGNLKFRCEMTAIVEDEEDDYSDTTEDTSRKDPVDNEKKIVAKGVDRLHQNLEKMFVEGLNSDFILKVENSEFPVHRCILSARSTVFAAMFEHDMSEKNSCALDIPDCSAEAFKVFLHYLYVGCVDTISSENGLNLYYAADKYEVSDLKEDCVEYMEDKLSVDTFCDVIALSLRHCESELQKEATRFFRDNIRKIIKTVQWQNYLRESPTHANELLIKALNA